METNCSFRIPLFDAIELQNGINKTKWRFDHWALDQRLAPLTVILMFLEEPQVEQCVLTASVPATRAVPGPGLLWCAEAPCLI